MRRAARAGAVAAAAWLAAAAPVVAHAVTAVDPVVPAAAAASDCDRPTLVLDPAISPAIVERDWARGAAHDEPHAALELRCGGVAIDRLALHAPLARLADAPLAGVEPPTWLVTEDLTAPAGTPSGPATLLVELVERHLRFAMASAPDGRRQPIVLATTGKAAWRAVRAGGADDYLLVACQPVDGDFVTTYRRYHATPQGWTVQALRRHELWESDGPFPAVSQFP